MCFSKLSAVRSPPPFLPRCHQRAVAAVGCPGGEVQCSVWRYRRVGRQEEVLPVWVNCLNHQAINFVIGSSWIVPAIIGEQ